MAQTEQLKQALENADAILIGAGAGLSASAGFTYAGPRFNRYFSDFSAKYGFRDMYSGGFFPYASPEEQWAYWSRYILINRYESPPKPVYEMMLKLVKNRNYFILTTNTDHCFQRAGFDKKRLFYTQGDYGLWQCAALCHQETYDNEAAVRQMVSEQRDMRVPSGLLPRCPRCGRPMSMNLRTDDTFVQDGGWYAAARRYEDFLRQHSGGTVLYLELGVGMNTPGIIKYNFWRQVHNNPRASYVCINQGQAYAPPEIETRSLCLNTDIGRLLETVSAR